MTPIDIYSTTWLTIEAWAKSERQKMVDGLIEGSPRDEMLRGHIQRLDQLLELGKPKPAVRSHQ